MCDAAALTSCKWQVASGSCKDAAATTRNNLRSLVAPAASYQRWLPPPCGKLKCSCMPTVSNCRCHSLPSQTQVRLSMATKLYLCAPATYILTMLCHAMLWFAMLCSFAMRSAYFSNTVVAATATATAAAAFAFFAAPAQLLLDHSFALSVAAVVVDLVPR